LGLGLDLEEGLRVDMEHEDHIHPEPTTFISKYIISYDHKIIAMQFLWSSLIFLAIGGTLAFLIRWQWAYPGHPVPILGDILFPGQHGVVSPTMYNKVFTMHGLIMIFFAITPILSGVFPNYLIPLMIGARDMVFPWLNMLSFWTSAVSQVMVLASFFVPLGTAGAGWTTYAPLSTNVGMPGPGQTLVIAALFIAGLGSVMGGINYITTVVRLRAPGLSYMMMPLTIWGIFITAILNVLFVPVLGSAALLALFDRMFGTQFFIAGASAIRGGGDPIVYQHLFWIFGHPEVYILILPVWGVVSDLVSFFSRKPAFWYRGSVYSMCAVGLLSAVVYGHHMFLSGMNPMLGKTFMTFTFGISIPSEILVVNWLNTIWKGSLRLTTPMLFALGVIFVFVIGGLTGLYGATMATDLYMHDTMFIIGHFHFTMAAASLMGGLAGIYFWYPSMFGKTMNETLGKVHFWATLVGLTGVFTSQLIVGLSGQNRRLYDPYQYTFLQHLHGTNLVGSWFGFVAIFGQLFFFYNVIATLVAGRKAKDNPWEVGTLDWSVPCPPKWYNFAKIPTVYHGPHEFSNPEYEKVLGRDWIGQTEQLPTTTPGAAAASAGR
jgi:cytochrome c oxidase subunit 1